MRDNTAYGKEQLVFSLSPNGEGTGLTGDSLGSQLRAGFSGELVQIFQDDGDEIEVRVMLSDVERSNLNVLDSTPILLPSTETVPLTDIADLIYQRGFESLRRNEGDLAVTITADVDESINNNNAVRADLRAGILAEIESRPAITYYKFGGDAEDQGETLGDVSTALPLALMLIFVILAWIFESYLWPLAVLIVVPFGIVGAVFGHWALGFDFTLMSIFGLFGLTGIVINDSIILVSGFRELLSNGMSAARAAVEASVKRCRAIILTSVTTVLGLTPILFESSIQAQFLKPLIISLAFGLSFATLIVLFLLPAILVGLHSIRVRSAGRLARLPLVWQ